jgi:uncharacterized protein YggE
MVPSRKSAGVTAAMMACFGTANIAVAVPLARTATLEISVHATVESEPDLALIHFALEAVAQTRAEARAQATSRLEPLVQLLKSNGVRNAAIQINRFMSEDYAFEEWIADDELVEGNIIGNRARVSGAVTLTDMPLAEKIITLLAKQGTDVSFGVTYALHDKRQELANSRARASAVRSARSTASAVAKKQGWRLAEMLPPKPPKETPGGGAADMGGSAPEDREWGPATMLTPYKIETAYDLVVTFRLVR